MADEKHTFAGTRTRLEEIVVQVRKKDTSLEQSLDLLEEGVRLANVCTELSDHTEWRSVVDDASDSTVPMGDDLVDGAQSLDANTETGADEGEPDVEADDDGVGHTVPAVGNEAGE
ncbi:MAG: exodeoxyribonuclease VII small subunit [Actinomycetota bacterium]|nr:exodeoxyribonuclease VII small subunit [Actinomycetota bacterium]